MKKLMEGKDMGLLETFYPSEIQDSTYVIPFEEWKKKGYTPYL